MFKVFIYSANRLDMGEEKIHEEKEEELGELEKRAEEMRLRSVVQEEGDDIDWILAPLAVTILRMNLTLKHKHLKRDESHWAFSLQLIIPFLLAGCGLLCTGILLDSSTSAPFFTNIPQAVVLVPVLLGLKGNLEMTFAARLSTLANVGLMDTRAAIARAFVSNTALTQVQAVIVSSLAVVVSMLMTVVHGERIEWGNVLCLLTTSVCTASLLSFVLGSFILLVVLLSKHLKINPDNITTPIAAAVGDLSTLATMTLLGDQFYSIPPSLSFFLVILLLFFFSLATFSTFIAARNELTKDVLIHGWWSVLGAMLIGCVSGEVLRRAVSAFPGIAVFQPLINGMGGNVCAVQASRISTGLHKETKEKREDKRSLTAFASPTRAFFSDDNDSSTARLLVPLSLFAHSLFFSLIFLLPYPPPPYHFSLLLALSYFSVAFVQVVMLLYMCQWVVRCMWRVRIDPDSSAIPLLTASGDLIGTALLSLSFFALNSIAPFLRLNIEVISP